MKILVSWYCGSMTGPMGWHGDFWEPDDCGTEFDTAELFLDFEEGECSAKCPKCGEILTQADDDPQRVSIT